MSDYIKRLAGPYIGTGTGEKTFTFGFFTYKADEIYVGTSMSNDDATTILEQDVDYTVALNDDQEAVPGGSITLLSETGLREGEALVIGSALDPVKTIEMTNYSRFPPEQIDTEFNRIFIILQQIYEETGRTLKVPATSSETPEDMIERLLAAQQTAQAAADAAEASAQAAEQSKDEAAEILEEVKDASDNADKILPYADDLSTVADNIDSVKATGGSITNVNIVAGDLDTTTQSVDVDYGDYDDNSGSGEVEVPTGGNIVIVATHIDAVDTVAENMASILAIEDKIDGLDTTIQAMEDAVDAAEDARDEAIQASKVAAFAYRYSATAIVANDTAPLTNLQPQDNIKVGDHIVDSTGNVFEITVVTPAIEETENTPATQATFTVGTLLTSIKGAKGDQGEQGFYFTPSVDSDGVISWTNNGNLNNPESVSIRGPKGDQGAPGPKGDPGTTDYNNLANKPQLGTLSSKNEVTATELAQTIDLGEYADA